jgi:hypothetical protein
MFLIGTPLAVAMRPVIDEYGEASSLETRQCHFAIRRTCIAKSAVDNQAAGGVKFHLNDTGLHVIEKPRALSLSVCQLQA